MNLIAMPGSESGPAQLVAATGAGAIANPPLLLPQSSNADDDRVDDGRASTTTAADEMRRRTTSRDRVIEPLAAVALAIISHLFFFVFFSFL
jgi:hypothetical protein